MNIRNGRSMFRFQRSGGTRRRTAPRLVRSDGRLNYKQSGAWSRLSRATQRQRENTTINLSPDVVKVSHQRTVRVAGPPATQQGLGPAK
jgi:hypothetical protein